MRAHEFVSEAKVIAKHPLTATSSKSLPAARTYPDLISKYYDMYRFGVAAAVAPDMEHDFAREALGPDLMTLQYSAADTEILNKAERIMGVRSKKINSSGSFEHDDVHVNSPVAPKKKNKYGV